MREFIGYPPIHGGPVDFLTLIPHREGAGDVAADICRGCLEQRKPGVTLLLIQARINKKQS